MLVNQLSFHQYSYFRISSPSAKLLRLILPYSEEEKGQERGESWSAESLTTTKAKELSTKGCGDRFILAQPNESCNQQVHHRQSQNLKFKTAGFRMVSHNAGKDQPLGDHFWSQFSPLTTQLLASLLFSTTLIV